MMVVVVVVIEGVSFASLATSDHYFLCAVQT
jgi:hypothetical protein